MIRNVHFVAAIVEGDPNTAPSPLPHKSTPLVSSMVEQSKMKDEPYEK